MEQSRTDRIARIVRWVLLASILVVTSLVGRLHSVNKAIPPIDSFCPFGGLESLYTVVTQGAFLKRIAMSSLILLGATLILALVFRRAFCGRICPLGFLQELTAKLGRLVFRGRIKVTAPRARRLDRIARYFKYGVLVYFLVITWLTGYLAIRPYDPWVAYHHLFSDELLISYLAGFILLILSLVGSMFVERPFCRYLCPMGGFLGLVGKAGLFRIRRITSSCIDCEACTRVCPVGIRVHELEKVTTAECLSCGECQTACPVDHTLVESTPRGRRTIKPLAVTLIVMLIFGGIITASSLTGDFIWNKNAQLPKTMQRILQRPDLIAGDNSLLEIVYAYRIPPQLFMEQFVGLTEEHFYVSLDEAGLDAENVRELVAMYLSIYSTGETHGGESCSE